MAGESASLWFVITTGLGALILMERTKTRMSNGPGHIPPTARVLLPATPSSKREPVSRDNSRKGVYPRNERATDRGGSDESSIPHGFHGAEAFAAEMFGEELSGPWAKSLSEDELDGARPVIREALDVTGFDEIRGYIFGDWAASKAGYQPRGLPDFVGNSVGYRMVREYLRRTERSAVGASYVPWREIVEGSRYL